MLSVAIKLTVNILLYFPLYGAYPICYYLVFIFNTFKNHKKTSFSSRHAAIGSHEKVKYGLFIDDKISSSIPYLWAATRVSISSMTKPLTKILRNIFDAEAPPAGESMILIFILYGVMVSWNKAAPSPQTSIGTLCL